MQEEFEEPFRELKDVLRLIRLNDTPDSQSQFGSLFGTLQRYARGAFQNVLGSSQSFYEPPKNMANSRMPRHRGVFIVPDGAAKGALETLCRRSVQGN